MATERGRADVKHKRDIRHNKQKLMKLEPHRLVFIDEMSTKTNMTRICGRSVKGTWLEADALYGHCKTQTFIAGLRHDGITAPRVPDGSMNRASFDVYVSKYWGAPQTLHTSVPRCTILAGNNLIATNLSCHSRIPPRTACAKGVEYPVQDPPVIDTQNTPRFSGQDGFDTSASKMASQ